MSRATEEVKFSPMTRMVGLFMRGDVSVLLILLALSLGLAALYLTPREEEPQIVVPLADVMISAPGLSADEVEQKITNRLERLLYQIDGVEYVYSMTRAGEAVVTVRFYVGQDREDSLVKLYNKIHSNVDQIPPGVEGWVVKPVEIDDVPILNLTLWSDEPARYNDYQLRRIAEQLQNELQAVRDTNRVWVIGGRPRRVRVDLDPARLAARETSALMVAEALKASNVHLRAGAFEQLDEAWIVDAGTWLQDADDVRDLVVALSGDRPVYLRDVATVRDGPAEPERYSWVGFGPAAENRFAPQDSPALAARSAGDGTLYPAVHIAVAKRRGSNAVWVARDVQQRMEELAATHLPAGVYYRVTRDYGETADEKVDELVGSLGIAVLTVIALIGFILGWRAALVIALVIPVCYSLALFVNLLAGYTINRVTLFALILALGLLVDDPITDVENISRYFAMRILPPRESVLRAVQEVRPALIMSTLAIIVSFLPLMFITGMMGPYMAPMALNVPLTVTISTLVAFFVSPWLAMVALRRLMDRPSGGESFDLTRRPIYRLSQTVLGTLLDRRPLAMAALGVVGMLFLAALAIPVFRLVPLKMLPYDNKNEFQIVLDMPEGTTLERTDAVTRRLAGYLAGVPEVVDYQLYVGTASPMDFNGMVRHYFLRQAPHQADIRVNLAPKHRRAQQSHGLVLRLRDDLTAIARDSGATLKVVEVPPGPPVVATITAEVYGPPEARYEELAAAAEQVRRRMEVEPGVVDVDISVEADQRRVVFVTDQPKAALSGVSKEEIARTLQIAVGGTAVTMLPQAGEVEPLMVELRLPRAQRSATDDLAEIYVRGAQGHLVQLGAIGRFVESDEAGLPLWEDKTIYHKNLRRVVYVFGEVAGRPPADAILDMELDRLSAGSAPPAADPRPLEERTWLAPGGGVPWAMPAGFDLRWAGEGEWKITLDVFRDLGIAFMAAQAGIFVLLMFQTGSRMLPLVMMLAIPLTMIGIMPGFWLLNVLVNRPVGGYPDPVFFTATAMIGMIALSGIVVRNSVVLIEFIGHGQAEGLPLREAIVRSVAVRTRPILLTAGTTLLGNWVITLDPIFSGLAWSIIFGIFASTLFTMLVIPLVYWLLYGKGGAGAAGTQPAAEARQGEPGSFA